MTKNSSKIVLENDKVRVKEAIFMPGEKFHYECQYMNDLDQVVTAGPSADTNEMCMAITYYFPASAGGSCN